MQFAASLFICFNAFMTEDDRRWIEDAIKHHDKRFPTGPDSISMSVVTAQNEQNELQRGFAVDKHGVINKSQSGRRHRLSMPSNLYAVLKFKYPDLFTDKEKYAWFKKKFPMFLVQR